MPAAPAAFGVWSGKWQALLGALAVAGLIAGELFVFWSGSPDAQLSSGAAPLAIVPRDVFAPVSGKVVAALCEKGATVKAGQICAQLDPSPFKDSVAREKAALATAEQKQEAAAAAAAAAKRDLERRQRIQGRGVAQRQAVEKARATFERAQVDADADAAAVQHARAAATAAEAALARLEVAAPVDGVIVFAAEVGSAVEAGKAVFSIAPKRGGATDNEKTSH